MDESTYNTLRLSLPLERDGWREHQRSNFSFFYTVYFTRSPTGGARSSNSCILLTPDVVFGNSQILYLLTERGNRTGQPGDHRTPTKHCDPLHATEHRRKRFPAIHLHFPFTYIPLTQYKLSPPSPSNSKQNRKEMNPNAKEFKFHPSATTWTPPAPPSPSTEGKKQEK